MTTNRIAVLVSIETESGVTEEGKAFCSIRCLGEDLQTSVIGQLPPDILRQMAMQFLESAEAADQDAATWRVMKKLDLPEAVAGMVITELRSNRKD